MPYEPARDDHVLLIRSLLGIGGIAIMVGVSLIVHSNTASLGGMIRVLIGIGLMVGGVLGSLHVWRRDWEDPDSN
jgi:uncharacterized membrane protein